MHSRIVVLLALWSAAALDAQTTHLSGIVRATWTGEPIAGAQIAITGSPIQTTDSVGRFDFPAARSGRAKLRVQYAGLASTERDLTLQAGKSVRIEVLADSSATDLNAVIVGADGLERQLGLAGFYARRRLGFGRFFSRADLERTHDHLVTQVLSTVGASYRCGGGGCVPVLFRGGRMCAMDVLVDGYPARALDITTMELDDVLAIEVYRSGYGATAGIMLENGYYLAAGSLPCGQVVIWTQAATPRSG